MERLGTLFGGMARIKVMRHFLMNPDTKFTSEDLCDRTKISSVNLRKEIAVLKKAGLIKDINFSIEGARGNMKKVKGYVFDTTFPYKEKLSELILEPGTFNKNSFVQTFKKIGRVRLLIISGVLTGSSESRVDILVVGKNLDEKKLDKVVREIESEIGRELVYASFEVEDFNYRMNMYDKLIADVLDFPHERLIDSLAVSTQRTVN